MMKKLSKTALCVFFSILLMFLTVTDIGFSTQAASYTVAKSYSFSNKASFPAGYKLKVYVTARIKAKVTATLDGEKITLTPQKTKGSGFTKFSGSFTRFIRI